MEKQTNKYPLQWVLLAISSTTDVTRIPRRLETDFIHFIIMNFNNLLFRPAENTVPVAAVSMRKRLSFWRLVSPLLLVPPVVRYHLSTKIVICKSVAHRPAVYSRKWTIRHLKKQKQKCITLDGSASCSVTMVGVYQKAHKKRPTLSMLRNSQSRKDAVRHLSPATSVIETQSTPPIKAKYLPVVF